MLPLGLTADLAPAAERAALCGLHPSAKTVARLLVGACSCDLVRPRLEDAIEDEREHRHRYKRGKLSRGEIMRELDRHRRGPVPRPVPPAGWGSTLMQFVGEHARNAGPTLYYLDFLPHDRQAAPASPLLVRRSLREVRDAGGTWLVEGQAVLVG